MLSAGNMIGRIVSEQFMEVTHGTHTMMSKKTLVHHAANSALNTLKHIDKVLVQKGNNN